MDGDRRADVVGVSHALGVVHRTAGGWRPVRMTQLPAAFRELPMVTGHVDGDSDMDVVVGPSRDGRVLVLRNDGSGTYGEGTAYAAGIEVLPPPAPVCRDGICGLALNPAAFVSKDLAAADLDRDGALDLAVAHSSTRGLTLLYGNGRGGFGPPARVAPGLRDAGDLTVADVNADGVPDLVALTGGDAVAVVLGRPRGGYRAAQVHALPVADARNLLVADVDGDGTPDLVVSSATGDAVLVLHNRLPRNDPAG